MIIPSSLGKSFVNLRTEIIFLGKSFSSSLGKSFVNLRTKYFLGKYLPSPLGNFFVNYVQDYLAGKIISPALRTNTLYIYVQNIFLGNIFPQPFGQILCRFTYIWTPVKHNYPSSLGKSFAELHTNASPLGGIIFQAFGVNPLYIYIQKTPGEKFFGQILCIFFSKLILGGNSFG